MSGFISVLVNNYVPSNIYTVTCLLALFQVIVLIFHRGVEAQTYKHTSDGKEIVLTGKPKQMTKNLFYEGNAITHK